MHRYLSFILFTLLFCLSLVMAMGIVAGIEYYIGFTNMEWQ